MKRSNSKIYNKSILIYDYTFNQMQFTATFTILMIGIMGLIFISFNNTPTVNAQGGLDKMIEDLKADGEALKAEIKSTNLYKTGLVEGLINKVYYYKGQISVMGGGTWAYLHDVQDTLLAKIKGTGEAGFTTSELASIDYFATRAAQDKIDHPSSNVFG